MKGCLGQIIEGVEGPGGEQLALPRARPSHRLSRPDVKCSPILHQPGLECSRNKLLDDFTLTLDVDQSALNLTEVSAVRVSPEWRLDKVQ